MAMRWTIGPGGDGASWQGFDGAGLLAATVVRYRDGRGDWWAAFLRGDRLPGRHGAAGEAMTAVDRATEHP